MSAPQGTDSVLPFTGGVFTLPLAVIGIASMVVGGVMSLFGKGRKTKDRTGNLPDISHLAV